MEDSYSNYAQPRASWTGALLRSLHPVRLVLCLVGLSVSLLIASAVDAFWTGQPLSLGGWRQDPLLYAQELFRTFFLQGFGHAVLQGGLTLVLLGILWSLIAGWIARAELLAQRAGMVEFNSSVPSQVSPTAFIQQKRRTLLWIAPLQAAVCAVLLIPLWCGGLINHVAGSVGAMLVAVMLPFFFIGALALAAVALGVFTLTIMPAALAAEGSDYFDIVSRGYSYFYQNWLLFLAVWISALLVAGLPVGLLVWLEPQAFGADGNRIVELAVVTLFLSLFWTLQSLVYVKLRRVLDDTPETEVWDAEAQAHRPTKVVDTSAPKQMPQPVRTVSRWISGVVLVGLAWWILCASLWSWSGEKARWIRWLVDGQLLPENEGGLYPAATAIAGAWLVLFVAWATLWPFRRKKAGTSVDGEKSTSGGDRS